MREYKFRAWDENAKRMWHSLPNLVPNFVKSNLQLMQYIGMKDRHNREIYEGDILRYNRIILWSLGDEIHGYEPRIAVVEYQNNGFVVRCINNSEIHNIYGRKYEIIGNIYENPELING